VGFTLLAVTFGGGLFAGMLLFQELGRRIGARQLERDPSGARAGVGVLEGAVFGLLALLLAFTFSSAATRFDSRRQLISNEVNAIGTAWLRVDLLPAEAQPAIRDGFRRYLDARLAAYRAIPDFSAATIEFANATRAKQDIWARTVAACVGQSAEPACMLLFPSLNQMFEIAEARLLAIRMHPPGVIWVMLATVALAAALLAGYGMASGHARNWVFMVGFAATTAVTAYVIVDLEYPRLGLIRIDSFDQALVDVRATMK
jgi:hypothetical protein